MGLYFKNNGGIAKQQVAICPRSFSHSFPQVDLHLRLFLQMLSRYVMMEICWLIIRQPLRRCAIDLRTDETKRPLARNRRGFGFGVARDAPHSAPFKVQTRQSMRIVVLIFRSTQDQMDDNGECACGNDVKERTKLKERSEGRRLLWQSQ